MESSASEDQFEMLRLYGQLIEEQPDWGGELVLTFGRDCYLVPVPVSIAGGTALLIDEDGAAVKSAMRRGELDFVVNTLDEALRVLKNQVRQKKPLAVGLIAKPEDAFAEVVERGVLPRLVFRGGQDSSYSQMNRNLERLTSAGARCPYLLRRDNERWQPSMIAVNRKRYSAWHVKPHDLRQLREADALLLSSLPADDLPRRRWLQMLPRYVRVSLEGGRWVWLSEEEFDALPDTLPISPEERP